MTVNIEQAIITAGAAATSLSIVGAVIGRFVSASFKNTAREAVSEAVAESTKLLGEQIDKTNSKVDEVGKRVGATELTLAAQFGGNSGGIRQKLDETAGAVAHLAGRFEQHIDEIKTARL